MFNKEEATETINFIKENEEQPFFLYLVPYAPHAPATPKNEDKKKFADFCPCAHG